MTDTNEFNLTRRYNSLRLLGFDYSSERAAYLITMNADDRRPVFGDIKLAKKIIETLLDDTTSRRLRTLAYTLLPDHLHLVAAIRDQKYTLSGCLAAYKSLTTQQYWKRS